MTINLYVATMSIGLLVGLLLGYIRGRSADSPIIAFVFGVLLGGSASPFLNVKNSPDFVFHVYVLSGLAVGAVIGLVLSIWLMELIYTREHNRKLLDKAP